MPKNIFVRYLFRTHNTESNDKTNLLFEKIWNYCCQNFSHCKIDGTWHTLSAMLLYQWHHSSGTVATMTSYWFQSDVIEMPFRQSTKHNSWLFPSCYGNISMLLSLLWFEGNKIIWGWIIGLPKQNLSIMRISGSISLEIWEKHGIYCMPSSSRIISEMLSDTVCHDPLAL